MSDLFQMDDEQIGYSTRREGNILIVTIRRGPMNTLPPPIHRPFDQIWEAFFVDPELRVAILTAEGDKAFSVGGDINSYHAGVRPNLPPNGGLGLTSRRSLAKPIIAAVNGMALGGGMEVMLACDLAIASEHAVFSMPEVKLGAAPLAGGVPRACRKIPHSVALAMSLGVQELDANQALAFGLINAIAPKGRVLEMALDWARKIAASGPIAVQAVKELADMALDGAPLEDMLQHSIGPLEEKILTSSDMREGMAAFLERRVPIWTGV